MTTNRSTVFGIHAVSALLQKQPERILRLCMDVDRQDKKMASLEALAREHGLKIEPASRQTLDQMTEEANHQGVVAVCSPPRIYGESDVASLLENVSTPPLVLVLDGIQDPHNLGACFRSADAAGVHAIIAPKDKSVGFNTRCE